MHLNSLKYKKSLLSVFLLTFFIVVFLSSYKAVSFFNFYSFSTKPIISNYNIVQHPLIPGGPIQWVKYVQISSVNNSTHLLAIPESATNIKISTTSANTLVSKAKTEFSKTDLFNQALENKQSLASQAFAEKIKKERAPGFWAALNRSISKVNNLLATVSEGVLDDSNQETIAVTLVDLEPVVADTIEETVVEEEVIEEITEEENTPVVENSEILTTEPAITEEVIEEVISNEDNSDASTAPASESHPSSTDEGEATPVVENSEILTTGQATTTATTTDIVVVEYETPAPIIAEAETDTGKIVSVSSDGEQEIITNVLAFTTIPEIFKVGQEDKIKIKWTNNDDQNVTFHAYDTNSNGKLDYVEWTVPHLSEQIFEIIFISKAFELDENKEIINDIYDTVRYQDGTFATIPATHYIRVTFEENLTAGKDMTIYAKGTGTITVFNENGSDSIGEFVVNGENTYKIFPNYTDSAVYDLLFTGNIEVDYIVDPDPDACTGGATDPDCWSDEASNKAYGPMGTNTDASESEVLSNGKANTAALYALGSSYVAGYYCYDLNEGGVPDGTWYLPSYAELWAGWGALGSGGFPSFVYWSSTEYPDNPFNGAGALYTSFGRMNYDVKTFQGSVRCLRGTYVPSNTAPSATITTPGTWNAGNVTITYKIIDAESDTSNITQGATSGIEYSLDNSTWVDATKGTGGDNMTGLTSSADPGTSHTFVWASATDLATTSDSTVYIRVRPNDGTVSADAWATSTAFGIDNVAPSGAATYPEFTYNGHTYQINPTIITGKSWGPFEPTGIASTTDGAGNTTALALLGPTYEAATAVKALSDGGYTDWFLPAIDELEAALIEYKAQFPTNPTWGGFANQMWYMSSTEGAPDWPAFRFLNETADCTYGYVWGAWDYKQINDQLKDNLIRAVRIKTGPDSISAPTFGIITTSSIVVNQPAGVTDPGSGLDYWMVRRDASVESGWIATTTSTYTSESLADNTEYTYDVRFKDAVGNISSYGTTANATTTIADITPPTISFTTEVDLGPVSTDTITADWGDATIKKWDYDTDNVCSTSTSDYTKADTDSMNQTNTTNNAKYICLYGADVLGNYATLVSTNPINISSGGGGGGIPSCVYDDPAWGTCSATSSLQYRTLIATNQNCTGVDPKVEEKSCIPDITIATTTYPLIINSEHGIVSKNPDKVVYEQGEIVTLTASSSVGYVFSSWTNGVASTTAVSTTVTMTATTTITANFSVLICPENQFVNPQGQCENKPDLCSNVDGIQIDIPTGKVRTDDGLCVADMCPNIEGLQEIVPVDKIVDGIGNCVIKLADVCSNIDGVQDSVPAGKILMDGACIDAPNDFCLNLDGLQSAIPVGMVITNGNCVYPDQDVCPNISGIQTTVPAGMYINDFNNCVSDNEARDEDNTPTGHGGGGSTGETVMDNLIAVLDVSSIITDNISILGTTTEKIVLGAKKALESPAGDVVAKTITTVGVVGGGVAVSSMFAMNGAAAADIFFMPFKMWGLLLSILGLKKRNRPWGTVYDSVTKQPIDPAYVTLKNLKTGKEEMSITDLDGRYGFLVSKGKYILSANKTNYVFPSKKLAGKTADALYSNLYFGEELDISDPSVLLSKNIPLDPLKFDWNEFTKGQKKLMKFYSQKEKILRIITDWLFRIGFLVSLVSLFLVSAPYNLIIFGLYLVLYSLRKIGLKQKSLGSLTTKAGNPLSFAIIRVFDAELKVEITNKVANKIGRYYCLVNKGKYYIKVEKKSGDEDYTEVFTSPVFEAKEGIINKSFVI